MASTESAIPPAQTEAEMPTSPKAKGHRRGSSSVTDVYKPTELSMSTSKHLIVSVVCHETDTANQSTEELIGAEGELKLAKEISKLNWYFSLHLIFFL